MTEEISDQHPIAYFCSEFALTDRLPIFAGGLGVLAGDLILEAAAENFPLVAIGLFYHHGFGKQAATRSFAAPLDPRNAEFHPLCNKYNNPVCLELALDHRQVLVRAWKRTYGKAQVILLDSDVPQNRPADRAITGYLYDPNPQTRLYQQLILGLGGVKLLKQLKINPQTYHLNEGHTCFVALELALEKLQENPEVKSFKAAHHQIKKQVVGTKHTIISAAGSFFKKEQICGVLRNYCQTRRARVEEVFELGEGPDHQGQFSTTRFLIKSCGKINAVSKLHAHFEAVTHTQSPLFPITNGIHCQRWQDLPTAQSVSGEELWQAHCQQKRDLITWINEQTKATLAPDILTIVWARRLAAYKRPGLIFTHPEKLKRLTNHPDYPIQFILAGNPNPYDLESQAIMKELISQCQRPEYRGRVVYLPNYSLKIAKRLVTGADIWLNTPIRGQEACGTSSMKSGVNGVLQLTTADGWVEEIDWDQTGWILPSQTAGEEIYSILENQVIPIFYRRNSKKIPTAWVARMKRTKEIIKKKYTTKRMLEDYRNLLYQAN